jgi:ribosomal-protein-alanine N-acetyltransferase
MRGDGGNAEASVANRAELTTPRLRLVASTVELVRAEIEDHQRFGRLLGARVPAGWPPGEAADALRWFLERLEHADPADAGWYGFYAIVVHGEPDSPVLVGGGGTLGPPIDGRVEIGYSLMPEFHGRGYATEMMAAVVEWIERDSRVRRIEAETAADNAPSRRLLDRLGFEESGPGREPETLRYRRTTVGSR